MSKPRGAAESVKGKKIVVLVPGSLNCRVGVADADVFTSQDELPDPTRCLHVLARPTTKVCFSIYYDPCCSDDKQKMEPTNVLTTPIVQDKDRDAAIEYAKRTIGFPPVRPQKATIKVRNRFKTSYTHY